MAPEQRWVALVPVKELAVAKTRLALPADERMELALTMASDVVSACLAARLVDCVVVVTNDPRAAACLSDLGAHVVADVSDDGLNPALLDGARVARGRWPRAGVVAVSSDLPALGTDALDDLLDQAAAHPVALVADRDTRGTTLLAARDPALFHPEFGTDSRHRHQSRGAHRLDAGLWPGASQDVDTLDDLRSAAASGLGPRTQELAVRLRLVGG